MHLVNVVSSLIHNSLVKTAFVRKNLKLSQSVFLNGYFLQIFVIKIFAMCVFLKKRL